MNVTQPLSGLHQVPSWPKLVATVHDDGTGTLMVNGTSRACSAESVTALRTGMVARCVAIATSLHRRDFKTKTANKAAPRNELEAPPY